MTDESTERKRRVVGRIATMFVVLASLLFIIAIALAPHATVGGKFAGIGAVLLCDAIIAGVYAAI